MKNWISKIFTVRKVLSFFLLLSVVYAGYSINYKMKYLGENIFCA